ncbi:MAG: hypothetical protein IJ805_08090 [Lachnospiraceae bacterium]|nr:hypothetical protein [Lachnospiraceae bacterium]
MKRGVSVLIMTGYAGLAGTAMLLNSKKNELEGRFSKPFLERTAKLGAEGGGERAGAVALKNGAECVFEVGEDGVFAGLWTFACYLERGIRADIRRIPIKQETIEIANHLDVNPYEISGKGAYLISAKPDRKEIIINGLMQNKINAVCIGELNDGNDRVLLNGSSRRFLTPVSRIEDEKKLRETQKNQRGVN